MRNKLFIFGVLLCFALMILSLVGCSNQKRIAKRKAKAEKEEYVNCVVLAKRYKDCKIWLSCEGKNADITDCEMMKSVNKLDIIQLKRK